MIDIIAAIEGIKISSSELLTQAMKLEGLDKSLDVLDKPIVKEMSQFDNRSVESNALKLKCRNEELAGVVHPETGVSFVKKIVEVRGEKIEVVVPEFESVCDTWLPNNLLEASDREQFKECNSQLKDKLNYDSDLKCCFDIEQLEQIENGDTPDGYTWHHDAELGKMQLVDTETHQKTGHTGGRTIWGGGSENR